MSAEESGSFGCESVPENSNRPRTSLGVSGLEATFQLTMWTRNSARWESLVAMMPLTAAQS